MTTTAASCPASLEIRGLRLLNLALDEAVTAIEAAVSAGHRTRIAFVNADCVNIAARDEAYRQTLNDMDWVFVDGIGMRLAGQLLKQPVRDNVNGTDLFPRLCEMLGARGGRLYLLGSQPGVAAAAARWAQAHYRGLQIAGTHDGYFDPVDSDRVAAEIRATRPDVLLVAMGAPRQEAWIGRHSAAAGATVTLGVGGLFDYYSGRVPRAPTWMRQLGLEWIFRLLQEPHRLWRRYLVGNPLFLIRVGRDWLAGQRTTRKPRRRNA